MLKLREIRKGTGLTMKELGAKVGVTESAIGLYETGKREPNYEMLLRLSEALGCQVSDIMGYSTQQAVEHLSEIDTKYNALDQHGKKLVKAVLDIEYARCIAEKPKSLTKIIPLFPAAAGPDDVAEGSPQEEYEDLTGTGDFAVRISGDSMEPEFKSGDIVLCKDNKEFEVGDIVVVMVNGGFLVKQFVPGYNGQFYLVSLNRLRSELDYTFLPSGNDTVVPYGKVIHKRIPLVEQ